MKVFVNTLSGHLRGVLENLGIEAEVQRVVFVHGCSQAIICSVSTESETTMETILKLLDDFGDKYSKAGFGTNYDNLYTWTFKAEAEKVAEALETFSNKFISRYYISSSGNGEARLELILNEQLLEEWNLGLRMLLEHLKKVGIYTTGCWS